MVDECLPVVFAKILNDHGHDAAHVVEPGMAGSSDEEVMALASDQERVVVSADTDFGELLALGKQARPSVVLLRGTVRRPEVRAEVLLENLEAFADDLAAGAIVVINDKRIRVRALPFDDRP